MMTGDLGSARVWVTESSTREGKFYLTARLASNGFWFCTCNPFTGLSQDCKHITAHQQPPTEDDLRKYEMDRHPSGGQAS